MPFAIAAPPTSIEPPRAFTPLTVSKSRAVSKSHSTCPSLVAKARKWPSTDPPNTAPGIAAAGADRAGLHDGLSPHALGRDNQACLPSARRIANIPPPTSGFRPPRPNCEGCLNVMSDSGTYMFVPSLADPHSTPPSAPPRPTVVLHSFLPP